jgi:hypothetical protein
MKAVIDSQPLNGIAVSACWVHSASRTIPNNPSQLRLFLLSLVLIPSLRHDSKKSGVR